MNNGLLLIGVAALGQLLWGGIVSSPWWVPDLILVMMVLRVRRAPEDAVPLVLCAALMATGLTQEHPWAAASAYGTAGWVVVQMMAQLDLAGSTMPLVMVGAGETLLLMVWVVLSQATVSLESFLLAGVRVGLTVGCFSVLRHLMGMDLRADVH